MSSNSSIQGIDLGTTSTLKHTNEHHMQKTLTFYRNHPPQQNKQKPNKQKIWNTPRRGFIESCGRESTAPFLILFLFLFFWSILEFVWFFFYNLFAYAIISHYFSWRSHYAKWLWLWRLAFRLNLSAQRFSYI